MVLSFAGTGRGKSPKATGQNFREHKVCWQSGQRITCREAGIELSLTSPGYLEKEIGGMLQCTAGKVSAETLLSKAVSATGFVELGGIL